MRLITVAVILGLAFYVSTYDDIKVANHEFILKQKTFLEILRYVDQYDNTSTYYTSAMAWNFKENYDKYWDVEVVKEFVKYYKNGMLGKDEVFSIVYDEHREWAISLFKTLFYSKDWDTFYNTMAWAKYHINRGIFVYALTATVFHHPLLIDFQLPAPSEINPYYFFGSETIEKARSFRTIYDSSGVENKADKYKIIVHTNYPNKDLYYNDDQIISYFTEDVYWNTFYYHFHMDYPFWMEGKKMKLFNLRGELYLFEHQQILARYYMERLSNNLGEITEFSWNSSVKTGYYPNLRYYNGINFPKRENNFDFYEHRKFYDIEKVENYERQIHDAIDKGFVLLLNGTKIDLTKDDSIETLGNMIRGNPDLEQFGFHKYLTIYARIILGSTVERNTSIKTAPSVLEHFETSMRDPLFYMLYKRLIKYYWQFKDNLPHYTRKQLDYDGMKIESIEVPTLYTIFRNNEFDITNAVKYGFLRKKNVTNDDFIFQASQRSLQNFQFEVSVSLNAEFSRTSVLRIFLGPKFNEKGENFSLNELRQNFWLLDTFKFNMMRGKHTIIRKSKDFSSFHKAPNSFNSLYKSVMNAYEGKDNFTSEMITSHCGYPNTLMLPKGWKDGMPIQFFFIITPYSEPAHENLAIFDKLLSCGIGSRSRYVDAHPLGYPFDRKIVKTEWYTNNMKFFDTVIIQKN